MQWDQRSRIGKLQKRPRPLARAVKKARPSNGRERFGRIFPETQTVVKKNQLADGMPPVVLAAIVIADGEELRTSKAMCKLPRPGH